MQASQPVPLRIVESFQQSQAFASRAARHAGRGAWLGALDSPAVGGVEETKEWSVGLSAPSASESVCLAGKYHKLKVFNKVKSSQAGLWAQGAALGLAPLTNRTAVGGGELTGPLF